ncbi:hypothetical protein [Streptomyces sp. DH12]|uniref:hypothetical protein n=1 Tax=Streptomyces sp. DH12 TaxID=2857010 RepID=UPI001E303214|nr:hypothetical protein [Streptomyces sp. DH12]
MNTRSRPEPPPEAALIKTALQRTRRTVRGAALESKVGETRWRQILSGHQTVGGTFIPVRAPADTLADMARVVGVTPAELRGVDRADAAEILEESTRRLAESNPQVDAIAQLLATLPPEAQAEVFRRLNLGAAGTAAADDTSGGQHRQAG